MGALSQRESDLLQERTKKEALKKCEELVIQFVECTRPRWISSTWACRLQLHDMNECVKNNNTKEDLDHMKLLYVREKSQQQK